MLIVGNYKQFVDFTPLKMQMKEKVQTHWISKQINVAHWAQESALLRLIGILASSSMFSFCVIVYTKLQPLSDNVTICFGDWYTDYIWEMDSHLDDIHWLWTPFWRPAFGILATFIVFFFLFLSVATRSDHFERHSVLSVFICNVCNTYHAL